MNRQRRANPCVRYMWTWNNPSMLDAEIFDLFDAWNLRYAVFQRERGANGTEHIQGYFEFKSKLRITQILKLPSFPASHLEPARGTRDESRDYCMKEDTRVAGPYEYPDVNAFVATHSQGKRTDLDSVAELVRSGASVSQVAEAFPAMFIKYSKGISTLVSLAIRPRPTPPVVILNYGPTGCGKSRMAFDYPTTIGRWVNPIGKGGWFDGYSGQDVAVFDDFAGAMSQCQLTDFLRITDRYSLQVPIKGGHVWWYPLVIIVTTNIHPKKWYDYSNRMEHFRAIQRRFTIVNHWRETGQQPLVYTPADADSWTRFWNGPIEEENGIAANGFPFSRALESDPYKFM